MERHHVLAVPIAHTPRCGLNSSEDRDYTTIQTHIWGSPNTRTRGNLIGYSPHAVVKQYEYGVFIYPGALRFIPTRTAPMLAPSSLCGLTPFIFLVFPCCYASSLTRYHSQEVVSFPAHCIANNWQLLAVVVRWFPESWWESPEKAF